MKDIRLIPIAALLFMGCGSDVFDISSDPSAGETYSNLIISPISTFLEESGNYKEYVKVLNYSDMYNALNQSSNGVSFTAFVPTDNAMEEFYQRRGVDSLQQLTKDYMRSFVLYHTVKDSILPEQFVTRSSVTNLTSDIITIAIDSLNPGQATLNGEGQVVEMGLSAYNGKVYVLSKAMTPLVETVYDRIAAAGSTIMLSAIEETGWREALSTVVDTLYYLNGSPVIQHYYFTVLNVTDEVFAKEGITSFSALKNELKERDTEGLSEDSLLREYVGYHLLPNSYTTDDLGALTGSNLTRIWSTEAMNQVLTVTTDTLASGLNRYTVNASGVSASFLSGSDILSTNGYVHQLSSWLPVWEPEQTEVLWDLGDYTEIKNIVPADEYQPAEPTSTEYRVRVSSAACFTYEMGDAGTNNHSYSDIDYVTCKNNLKAANNFDRIVFNLGYMGNVQMPTPTIVRGKYRLDLQFIYITNNNFMRQQTDGNGGLLRFSIDDNDEWTTFSSPYTTVTSPLPGVYSVAIYPEVYFPETSSHNFKFVVLDPAASTNSNFSLQFDCIKFIPVE